MSPLCSVFKSLKFNNANSQDKLCTYRSPRKVDIPYEKQSRQHDIYKKKRVLSFFYQQRCSSKLGSSLYRVLLRRIQLSSC